IGEIEIALRACAGVEDAAVVVRGTKAGLIRALAAFVEPQRGVDHPPPRDLVAALRHRLPSYMIPATVVVLDALPRLPNLKIDRVRLAQLDAARAAQAANPVTDPLLADVVGLFDLVLGTT